MKDNRADLLMPAMGDPANQPAHTPRSIRGASRSTRKGGGVARARSLAGPPKGGFLDPKNDRGSQPFTSGRVALSDAFQGQTDACKWVRRAFKCAMAGRRIAANATPA